MIRHAAAALMLVGIASTAHAAKWQADMNHSSLTFSGSQASQSFTGSFSRFTSEIDFDPAQHKGHVKVSIDMASATITTDKEQNDALPTEDWFFTQQFPTATFDAPFGQSGLDSNSYMAQGPLTLRGVSKPIMLAFTLDVKGNTAYAEGETTLMRKDFKLGGKQWADDRWIAYPVKVHFTLKATRQ